MQNIRQYQGIQPSFGKNVYIDEFCCIIGRVNIGDDASIWPGVVIRGDVNHISIGNRTNIQDLSVLHVSTPSAKKVDGFPLWIGDDVTVGHRVILHGCTIQDRVLIGTSTIVLDGAVVQEEVLIGAGSLVPPGKILASGFLYLGSPVRQIRPLSDQEKKDLLYSAEHYVRVKNQYLE